MGKQTKSASNILHGILVQHAIGYEFDIRTLQQEPINYGYDFSEGAITGFIVRAIRKGIVTVKGTTRPKGQQRTRRLYILVDKQDWLFKSPGIGSYPGRKIMGHHNADQTEIFATSAYLDPIPGTDDIPVEDIIQQIVQNDPEKITYDEGSISDQLINLAIKVNELENRPVKTLSDYSTNDLIEELKTRVK